VFGNTGATALAVSCSRRVICYCRDNGRLWALST